MTSLLSTSQTRKFYELRPLAVPSFWSLSRKHFRVRVEGGKFVKLNNFQNRLTAQDVRFYCAKLAPQHVYFSVLNWLFPERVGKEYKARYCGPLDGEYVIDVDAFMVLFKHNHWIDEDWNVCESCLDMAKRLTLQLCEALSQYYRDLAIVFSGRMGFHVHVMDFDYRDWATYREKDPVWCHHAARFKFTKLLQKQTHVFDRRHFTVSCDPMRVVTVPNTLNAETGLVCSFIGGPRDLEPLSISEILDGAKEYFRFSSHAETLENPADWLGGNGSVKTCAKNLGEAAVTV